MFYEFQVSAATTYGSSVNEGSPSTVTTNTAVFVPEPGKTTEFTLCVSSIAYIVLLFYVWHCNCTHCGQLNYVFSYTGLPKPVNVGISRQTNVSLTVSWDYPPPPIGTVITNFIVCSYTTL